jgi:predicted O-methyltransferase YrrM
MRRFLSDKMVALDRDKAMFCYLLCRSMRARCVVEAGTSYGVSTLYLAAAVRDNQVENGVVIGTEYEPRKVEIARRNFEQAGLSEFIDLREGDLRQTLRDVGGPVDFMLVDIWDVALPALELVARICVPGPLLFVITQPWMRPSTATTSNLFMTL